MTVVSAICIASLDRCFLNKCIFCIQYKLLYHVFVASHWSRSDTKVSLARCLSAAT